jgi:hypothetical protein
VPERVEHVKGAVDDLKGFRPKKQIAGVDAHEIFVLGKCFEPRMDTDEHE